jgi:hypothetical protein
MALGMGSAARRQVAPAPRHEAALALMLADGGDERIKPDALTGRTKYGTPAGPAPREIWFSSSTATAIDRRGLAAAGDALTALIGQFVYPAAWFEQLRRRIGSLFGVLGSETILTASGTEAEFIALSVARAASERPLTSIVVGPTETGRGVTKAAGGRHFLASTSLGGAVEPGARLAGIVDVEIETIPVRDPAGLPRPSAAIDADAAACVARALAAGRDVLLHVLDTSKTGLGGVTRQQARELAANRRVYVVVDACQLRCPRERLQADLRAGFMVMITGSKFAGGPPFAGALLLPPGIAKRLDERPGVPAGLAAYSALFDWPTSLQRDFTGALDTLFNLGLGLRWEAALASIEAFFAIPETLRTQILTWFATEVRRHIAARPHLRLVTGVADSTIFPLVTEGAEGPAEAAALYRALAEEGADADLARSCHVGQPVEIGKETALRICASMPLVLDIAAHMAEGRTINSAPAADDLDFLFRKWDRLAAADALHPKRKLCPVPPKSKTMRPKSRLAPKPISTPKTGRRSSRRRTAASI